MSLSRIVSIVGLIAAALGTIGGFLDAINPDIALFITAAGAGLTAFNERIQGGVSTGNTEGQ